MFLKMASTGLRLSSPLAMILAVAAALLGCMQTASAAAPDQGGTSGLLTVFRLEQTSRGGGYQAVLHGCLNVLGAAISGDRGCSFFYISSDDTYDDYIAAVDGEKRNTCQIVPDITGPLSNGRLPDMLLCRAGLSQRPSTLAVFDERVSSSVFRNSPKANHYYFLNYIGGRKEPPLDAISAKIDASFGRSEKTNVPDIFWMRPQPQGFQGGSEIYTRNLPGTVPIWIRYEVRKKLGYRESLGPRGSIQVMKSEPLTAGPAEKVKYGPFGPAGALSSGGSWNPDYTGAIFYQTISESNGRRYSLLESREGPCGQGQVLKGFECDVGQPQIRFPLAADGSINKIFYVLPQESGETGSQWVYFSLKDALESVNGEGVTPWKLRLKWVPSADQSRINLVDRVG